MSRTPLDVRRLAQLVLQERNEPANLAKLVPFLASARGAEPGTLAARTTENAKRLFGPVLA